MADEEVMVVKLMRLGVSFPEAAKMAIGKPIQQLAEEREVNDRAISALLNGSASTPYVKEREVLLDVLGLDELWLNKSLECERLRHLAGEKQKQQGVA